MILLTKNEISAIKTRCNHISSEKWSICKINVGDIYFYDVISNDGSSRPHTRQECEFIVHARTDIPKLIQHIDYLQKSLLQYEQALGELGYLSEQMIG
jgi:hypothetical protein